MGSDMKSRVSDWINKFEGLGCVVLGVGNSTFLRLKYLGQFYDLWVGDDSYVETDERGLLVGGRSRPILELYTKLKSQVAVCETLNIVGD